MTEDEMVGWHHQLNGHEFEQGLGVSAELTALGISGKPAAVHEVARIGHN